ncbi:MAG TPA: D-aminoacylase [Vicinamibacterales bacterium]|nr:D-aminoacylase [Vicinamibacterales bacterium]
MWMWRRGLMLAVLVAAAPGCQPAPLPFDLVLLGGRVVDGTGQPPQRADIGIRGDRIAEIGELASRRTGRAIDVTGLVVSPGFIDVQGQSGVTLLADGRGESHLRQGITTEIIGEASSPAFWTETTSETDALAPFGVPFDWNGLPGYAERLRRRGTTINLGTLVPATMARREIVGLQNRTATPDELARMEAFVDQAMRDGAFGVSSALIYAPGAYASTDELVALARVAGRYGGVYVSHVRGESFRLLEALDEAVRIGREAAVPVVIFHLKVAARANWGRMSDVVRRLGEAQQSGVDVSATMYPYTAGGTNLNATLPLWVQEGGREAMLARLADPAVRARARREIETTIDGWENLILGSTFDGIQVASVPAGMDHGVVGRRIGELARERNQDPWETYFSLLRDGAGQVGALFHMMSEQDVRTGLGWGSVTIGTDSAAVRPDGLLARGAHPRAYGTFPRVLGTYVRDEGLLSLPEAIRRMTSAAAAQFRIRDRGILRAGMYADVVAFDLATIADRATYEQPHQYPAGVRCVVVNGVPVIESGELTGARPGRPIFGPALQPATRQN